MKLGAIDIGSNAARVLIMDVKQVDNELEFNKLKLLRYPIRLGMDAFLDGKIGEKRQGKMVKMCTVFRLLMDLYDVKDYRAIATSAMRESSNGDELVKLVENESGVAIEIIDGNKEATILYQTHFEDKMRENRNYIYVDVGGGSTEVSIFLGGKLVESKSFQIGTIRMMHNLVGKKELDEIKRWVKEGTEGQNFWGIGSGGNINTLFSMSGKRKGKPLKYKYINKKHKEFKKHTVKELMDIYGFKQDRADVIVNALKLYKTAFKASGAKKIFVLKLV